MKTLIAIAVGTLALVGCGPLDESELETHAAIQSLTKAGQRPDLPTAVVPHVAPKDFPSSDQEKLYAPERPTFLTSFIHQTEIDPDGSPVKP